jgi:predicted Zn-dependent peptidase
MFALYKPTTSAKAVADAIQEEIGKIARQGIPAADLARVKTKMRSDYYASLELPIYRADAIALAQLLTGNAASINEVPDKLEAVTAADLQRVATTYLTVANRTVVDRKPAPAPAAAEKK